LHSALQRTDDAITLPTAVNKVVVEARVAHDLGPPSIEIVRTNSVQLVGELDTAGELSAHAHHVFLLSDAGKPIYSRHGDCDAHANLFAVIQTLCANRAEQGDDTLHSFKYRYVRGLTALIGSLHNITLIAIGDVFLFDPSTNIR
jgi:hypothetical protein